VNAAFSDAVLTSAVDLARAAVLEIAPADHVGDHLGVLPDGDGLATHTFACLAPGYRGWTWGVTVAVVPDGATATVSEVVLLPGEGALLAPAWVPWNERVRAGDLGPGDLHPTAPDDPRLEPGYGGADALEEVDETASTAAPLRPEQWELGLGRETVLSPYGRGVAADRWYDGDYGPESPMAKAAPGRCRGCGFLLPMGGSLGQVFGVCANELGADGRVVALDYGCGAHSSVREIEGTGVPVTELAIDEYDVDRLDLGPSQVAEALEVPAVVAELMAEDGEVLVVAEPEVPSVDEDVERWLLDRDLVEADALEGVGLPADEDETEDDEYAVGADELEDAEGYDEGESDEDVEDESDEGDEGDDEDEDGVSPDQIALELDDVVDIEPDETL
jgi:hypothetical protein